MTLERLLAPRSIAIAGISNDQSKHGGRVLGHLRRLGFKGQIFGVNPRLPSVPGLDVFPSVADIDEPPDLVVCAVPARAVLEVISACDGVGCAIVFAGGFNEAGGAGRQLETELRDEARRLGVRVLGPNSGGLIRRSSSVAASFLTCLDRPLEQIRSGHVAIVTQSGGIGSHLNNVASERGNGLAVTISTGNETDIAVGEAIEAVSKMEETRVVLTVIETIRDGPEFMRAIESSFDRGVPVIGCRIGTGEVAHRLMSTHTGAMAIPHRILDGVLSFLDVTMADTPAEAYEIAEMVARSRTPQGDRVGIVTHSGGMAIHLADLGERRKLVMPQPGPELVSQLRPMLDHGAANNPLDMGGIIGGPGRFAEAVSTFARSPGYDIILAVSTAHPPLDSIERARSLCVVDGPATVLHLWMAGDQAWPGRDFLNRAGAAITDDQRAAVGAASALSRKALRSLGEPPDSIESSFETWGVPIVDGEFVTTEAEAIAAAHRIGFPVAVKAHSEQLLHKTEVGGVRLDVRDTTALARAFRDVTSIEGVEVARVERYRPGLEMIVGGFVDSVFGPLVTVGVGGTLTEVIGDVVFAPAPVRVDQAMDMINRLRTRRILDGVRGSPPADAAALADIVSRVSRGFVGSSYNEVDLNPVIWDGTSWIAVDWLLR